MTKYRGIEKQMKTQSLQPDVAALGTVVDALQQLDDQQRLWVLQTAASRFSLRTPTSASGGGTPAVENSTSSPSANTQVQSDRDISPKTFLREKNPQSDVQRISCLAYYLTDFRETARFRTKELTELNAEASYPNFSNPTVAVNNARKAKYLTPAGGGYKKLTNVGEDLVNALPDQEKVRSLTTRANRRKNRAPRKK